MKHPFLSYPTTGPRTVLGLISGTSADGVDVASVRISPEDEGGGIELLEFDTVAYPSALKKRVLRASKDDMRLRETALLHTDLGEFFGQVAKKAMPEVCHLVASHGQTVCHLPEAHTTLQLGEGSIIANRTGVLTITDFRPADLALGGQGAPLVPLFDAHLLRHPEKTRVAINLGGIANITIVGPEDGQVFAWDTGPANCVSDALCRRHGVGDFDPDGIQASQGQVDEGLLTKLLGHSYFAKAHPKSTGLEDFGDEYLAGLPDLPLETLLRTALAVSAQSLVDSILEGIQALAETEVDVVFAGGGTRNRTLMKEIRTRLVDSFRAEGRSSPGCLSFSEFGIAEDAREAVAFAFLGDQTMQGLTGTLPTTTGARRAALLGKLSFPSP